MILGRICTVDIRILCPSCLQDVTIESRELSPVVLLVLRDVALTRAQYRCHPAQSAVSGVPLLKLGLLPYCTA